MTEQRNKHQGSEEGKQSLPRQRVDHLKDEHPIEGVQSNDEQMVKKEIETKDLYLKELEEPGQRLESGLTEEFHKCDLGEISGKLKVL
jgi:predicted small metal-binding protein